MYMKIQSICFFTLSYLTPVVLALKVNLKILLVLWNPKRDTMTNISSTHEEHTTTITAQKLWRTSMTSKQHFARLSAKIMHPKPCQTNCKRARRRTKGTSIFTWPVEMGARKFAINQNPSVIQMTPSFRWFNWIITRFDTISFNKISWLWGTRLRF